MLLSDNQEQESSWLSLDQFEFFDKFAEVEIPAGSGRECIARSRGKRRNLKKKVGHQGKLHWRGEFRCTKGITSLEQLPNSLFTENTLDLGDFGNTKDSTGSRSACS